MGELHSTLKNNTKSAHEQLHHHPLLSPLMSETITQQQYQHILLAFHAFYGAVAQKIPTKSTHLITDIERLERDIHVLDAHDVAMPNVDLNMNLADQDAYWGAHYVIIGSHLGGQMIAKQVAQSLAITPQTGLSFFYGEGKQTALNWRKFLAAMEASTPNIERCCHAASSVFQALNDYFCCVYHAKQPILKEATL